MGHITKIQKVQRPTNKSFYVNLSSSIAEAINVRKGEKFEWLIENKNLLLLKRLRKKKSFKSGKFRL